MNKTSVYNNLILLSLNLLLVQEVKSKCILFHLTLLFVSYIPYTNIFNARVKLITDRIRAWIRRIYTSKYMEVDGPSKHPVA